LFCLFSNLLFRRLTVITKVTLSLPHPSLKLLYPHHTLIRTFHVNKMFSYDTIEADTEGADDMQKELIDRFTTYAKMDTQSDEKNEKTPSTPGQLEMGNLLVDELKAIGMSDVTIDDYGYVMATLPANTDKDIPTIGFLAHVDTATDFTGENVNPQIVENFDGKDLTLNEEIGVVLSAADFPELPDYQGHTLITTDGTTLLGADNKAGIAEIMT